MRDERDLIGNQRGMALVAAILVLVFLSVIATSMIVSINSETKLAGRTGRADRALNTAEAGIAEAMERIRKGDIPDNASPKMVAQIFLVQPGDVPVVGTDSIALPTWQSPNGWLTYSTPKKSSDVLTVTYKTDAARTKIYRYDATLNPAIQTSSGQPIYVITATGQFGDAKRTIVTEVMESDIKTFCKGAVVAKNKIHIAKDSWLCGYNHSTDTPEWTNVPKGRDGSITACNDDLPKGLWEVGSGDIPGAWSGKKIDGLGNGKQYGLPSAYLTNQSGFYTGPWDVLGMTQAEFFQLVGPPVVKPKKLSGDLSGIHYYDADGKKGKNGGHVEIKNGEGTGLLYVEGDLNCKGDFTWHGLVYATGKVLFEGRAWVLGCVIGGRDVHLHVKDKECAVLYSHSAIVNGISQFGAPFVTLSWRERP